MTHSPKPPLNEPATGNLLPGGEDLRGWVLQYGPALRRYFLRRAPGTDVDDLIQEVFLSLQARGASTQIDNVEGYLFRTAANVLGQRRRRTSWAWGRQENLDELDDFSDDISPERILLGKEAFDAMMDALADLPPRSALAFMLFRVEQLPQEVVARRMGISVRAVQALVQRAASRIFEQMGARP